MSFERVAREPEKNFHAAVPPMLLAQAQQLAQQDDISLDEIASEALRRLLAQRTLERLKRASEARRGSMSDDEVEKTVARAIEEYRQGRTASKPDAGMDEC